MELNEGNMKHARVFLQNQKLVYISWNLEHTIVFGTPAGILGTKEDNSSCSSQRRVPSHVVWSKRLDQTTLTMIIT